VRAWCSVLLVLALRSIEAYTIVVRMEEMDTESRLLALLGMRGIVVLDVRDQSQKQRAGVPAPHEHSPHVHISHSHGRGLPCHMV